MESDDHLGSFTTPDTQSNSSGIFVPTAIALAGVLLGGIALYLAFAGSGTSDETKAAISAANSQVAALEGRLSSIEAKLATFNEEVTTQDTRLRNLASQTQTALNQVGQEMNATRKQIESTADKVQEISRKLAVANAPRPRTSPANASASSQAPQARTEAALPQPDTATYKEHTIASGETFARLANRYEVTIDAILAANPDVDPRRLQVGQKIKIPHNAHARE